MGRLVGLEPTSAGATIQCVDQLHHSRHVLKDNNTKEKRKQQAKKILLIIMTQTRIIHGTGETMELTVAGKKRQVLIEYKRIKNIYLRIGDDGSLRISCSRYVTQKQIREFILSKESWIAKAETKVQNRTDHCSYGRNNEPAMWLGKQMRVSCVPSSRDYLSVEENELVYHLRTDSDERRMAVFYKTAGEYLKEMIQVRRGSLDQSVCVANRRPLPQITLKYMTSRWGSCTPAKSRISISVRLIHFPPVCLDYVLTHEYAHILVANHSKAFYAEIAKRMPDYRRAEMLLK